MKVRTPSTRTKLVNASVATALAIGLAATMSTANSETGKAPVDASTDSGRFSLAPVEGGVLRLDRETGQMTLCTTVSGKLKCDAVNAPATGRSATKPSDDLAALRDENRELKDRIRSLEEMIETTPPEIDGGPPPPAPIEPSLKVPSEEDVDRALDYVERILKKFRERIRRFDDPLPPEGTKPPTNNSSPPL